MVANAFVSHSVQVWSLLASLENYFARRSSLRSILWSRYLAFQSVMWLTMSPLLSGNPTKSGGLESGCLYFLHMYILGHMMFSICILEEIYTGHAKIPRQNAMFYGKDSVGPLSTVKIDEKLISRSRLWGAYCQPWDVPQFCKLDNIRFCAQRINWHRCQK